MASKIMDELWEQIEKGMEDAATLAPDLDTDDIAWEVVNNFTLGYSQAVRKEMLKRAGFHGLE